MAITIATANVILDSWRGVSNAEPVMAVKLHTVGPPSSSTDHPSVVTTRMQIVCGTAASGGAMSMTGAAPIWDMTDDEEIAGVSLWNAFTTGRCLGLGALTAPATVANGDKFSIVTFNIMYPSDELVS